MSDLNKQLLQMVEKAIVQTKVGLLKWEPGSEEGEFKVDFLRRR